MTTILFVEDQLELRSMHVAYLEDHGYNVVTAADGEAGLALARSLHPDIVVLDHSLPGCTGVEVAQAIHDDPALANTPIILYTAMAYGAVGLRAQAAGCVGFLSKPCLPSRLLREVMRLT